jgi:O-antigen/teichoic acid export membrane protein
MGSDVTVFWYITIYNIKIKYSGIDSRSKTREGVKMSEGIAKKAVSGSVFLIIRQFGINFVNFIGNLIIARILIPADFGIYTIIQFVLAFLTLVGDGGLGAALLRKSGEPSEKELEAVFTYQQLFMAVITVLFIAVTFFLKPFVHDPASLWLFRASAISYFLLSFRIIPVMMLERNLHFGKIAILEVLEVLSFQVTAVCLAFFKMGAWALVAGLVAKNASTLLILLFISDWKMKYHWDFKEVKPIIPFGISFQGFHFVNLVKDSFVPVWVGTALGMASVGFINWANTIVSYPLLASNIISRILFPFFSKIHEDNEKLKRALELIISMNVFVIFGVSCVIWGLAEPITKILYTEKWMPALTLFNFFIPINLILAVVYPIVSAFNARGRVHLNFVYSITWAAALWIFAALLVPRYGIAGFGAANLLMNLISLKYFLDAKKEFSISILPAVVPALGAFVLTAAGLKFLAVKFPVNSLIILAMIFIAGLIVYSGLAMLFSRGEYGRGIMQIVNKAGTGGTK